MAAVCLVCVWAEAAGDMRCGTSALAKSLTESRPLSIYQIPFGDGPNECSVSRALWPCSAIFVLWLLLSLRQASFLSLMLPASRLCLAPAPLRWSASLASLSLLASLSRSPPPA